MIVHGNESSAELTALLSETERRKIWDSLSRAELEKLEYDWSYWARQNQKAPPGPWITWLILAGRGFGKTRTGAQQILEWKKQGYKRFSLMAKTPGECRDIMILGESGILACCPPWDMPEYSPSKLTLTWADGAVAHIFSAENYEQSRGAQCEKAWCDEVAKYKYPEEALDNLMFGLRLGDNPQIIITTTPKPIKTIKTLIADKDAIITRGSTYENKSNLADSFIKTIVKKYENTRLGRQELYAEILDDNPNALWRRADIDNHRIHEQPKDLVRIVVAIDPAVTSGDESDDTGIVIAGLDKKGHGYILADMTMKGSPEQWARKAVGGYYSFMADKLVGEANNGGDMIEFLIRNVDRNVNYRKVHASKGKYTRAEPIAALYEQGRIHHVGYFGDLEDQMCEWQPGDDSPNNLDAMVWALTDLFLKQSSGPVNVRT